MAAELDETIDRVRTEVGEDEAAIFRAHRVLLRDPAFVAKVKAFILNDQLDAASSLNKALEEYDVLFARIRDDYLRERMTDIRDVVEQIITTWPWTDDRQALGASEPVILVAPEIRPSQAAMFDKLPVSGIATEAGGSDRPRRHPGPRAGHPGRLRPARVPGPGAQRRPADRGRPGRDRHRQPRPGGRGGLPQAPARVRRPARLARRQPRPGAGHQGRRTGRVAGERRTA